MDHKPAVCVSVFAPFDVISKYFTPGWQVLLLLLLLFTQLLWGQHLVVATTAGCCNIYIGNLLEMALTPSSSSWYETRSTPTPKQTPVDPLPATSP